jgi:acetyltransferase
LPRAPGTERKESNLRAVNEIAAKAGKPIVFFSMISHGLTDYSRNLRADLPNIAFLQETSKALAAASAVISYGQQRGIAPAAAKSSERARQKLTKFLAGPVGARNEVESKALLNAYGIRSPKELVAGNEAKALKHAKAIGFPVVMKAVSAALPHKSDVGAVALGIETAKQARDAFRQISRAAAKQRVELDGVLVAQQVTDGIELALGLHRDPEMGMVIMCGAGGTALELERDVALGALPLDAAAAEDMIASLRISRLIDGYRGQSAFDRSALVNALLSLSQLAMHAGDRIESLDVNPFLLRRRGALALDALVVRGG